MLPRLPSYVYRKRPRSAVRNVHQEFAEILSAQESDEGSGRFPKPFDYVFAILDPSLANPGGDIVYEIPIAPNKVGDLSGEGLSL